MVRSDNLSKVRVGVTGVNTYGSAMKIIEYNSTSDIWVKFISGNSIHTTWQAFIKGNVSASNINVAGTIEGDVSSVGILKLLSTAKLIGSIQVKSLICDEGSVFDGNCKMLENQASKPLLINKKKDFKKISAIDEGQPEM
jgi:hypothetical protein